MWLKIKTNKWKKSVNDLTIQNVLNIDKLKCMYTNKLLQYNKVVIPNKKPIEQKNRGGGIHT